MSGKSGSAAKLERAVLIAGPTASGKSALAVEKARATNGVIVNADSMQVYDVLNVLSARPAAQDLAAARHHLYGFVSPVERFSTGAWLNAVQILLSQRDIGGRTLIFVGGTGLYFQALINGFTPTPEVLDAVVQHWNHEVEGLDRAGRRALLDRLDPQSSAQIKEPDPQRVVRAVSVIATTGRSLVDWQTEPTKGLLPEQGVERIVLNPGREILRQRIADRFEQMFDNGAVAEVEALLSLNLSPDLPAMKAIGVPQIRDWMAGRISQDEAVALSVTATRQYAKRQRTWFRKQMADWDWVG